MAESTPLTLEEAIKTAIQYETRVRDLYREAETRATDDVGKQIFQTLAREEQGHLDYLNSRLQEWQKTGSVTPEKLDTVIPSPQRIGEGMARLESNVTDRDWSVELALLEKALNLEAETGAFYKKMVSDLPTDDAALFARFLEIEDGHYAIVQAQIDALTGAGFWFDFMEFRLEGS